MIGYWEKLCEKYPIRSVEDPLGEEDFPAWTTLTERIGNRTMLVGDDLFVTNPARIREGIERCAANALLVKPNQIGTLTETLTAIGLARDNGMKTILSHRSGETEDTTIADIAVAVMRALSSRARRAAATARRSTTGCCALRWKTTSTNSTERIDACAASCYTGSRMQGRRAHVPSGLADAPD